MRPYSSLLVLALAAAPLIAGCGSAEQDIAVGTTEFSQLQSVRESLEKYAQTGQLDSGVEMLPTQIEGLKDEGVENVDELKQAATDLASAGSPAEVKKQAQALLDKLPQSAAAS
ncbi:hypothetical protein Mal4_25470 [Maioricimonas rarisocia]|uniref:Lipoprotein n=1 Tax=Maioricimonas rarisocia TaxID=2528026 RepID=A0A517Z6V5_9PLAN|nr:hypothetical protein [Maioricimonas rarisocia]QDU38222.1 hypothetical protein Mal4_25470 [Maioricimonas rarisocia]